MCKLAALKQAHCLIQIFPRFEPAALIGAHGHCVRSGANTEFFRELAEYRFDYNFSVYP
jgi:hypothetical protein